MPHEIPPDFDPAREAQRLANMSEDERTAENILKFARMQFQMYNAYVTAGFTPQQALSLILGFMQAGKK